MAEYPPPNKTTETLINQWTQRTASSSRPNLDGVAWKMPVSNNPLNLGIEPGDGWHYEGVELVGSTSTLSTAYKSLLPTSGAGIFALLPTSNQTLQLTSSSTADVGQQIFVLGYNISGSKVYDIFQLNGQNRVTGFLGTSFYRVLGGQLISGTNLTPGSCTAGNIYLTLSSYATFTAGVPGSLSNCLATASAGTGVLVNGIVSIKPGGNLYPSRLVVTMNSSGTLPDVTMSFFSSMGGGPWRNLSGVCLNSTLSTMSLSQSSFPGISTDFSGTQWHDLMLCPIITAGTTTAVNIFAYLSCQIVYNV